MKTYTSGNECRGGNVPARLFAGSVFCCVLAFAAIRCAGQLPPSGGPVDTVPPQVVTTFPDSNATRVETQRFVLEFSKYVDRRSVEESIFISPYVGEMEFDWSGREVTITFAEQLKRDRTYVVNVGTDVVDVRAGNHMAAGYTLAFATGDSIDRGFISGRVFDDKPAGVMIFAYELSAMNPDTLNPAHVRPDYIMQTGVGGSFTLAHLALSRYRLMAVRDEFKNLIYDKEIDAFGVPARDVVLTTEHPAVANVWFRLSKEDTTKPFMTSAAARDCFDITVRFSEPVDTARFGGAGFSVTDTVRGTSVPVALAYVDRAAPTVVMVMTGSRLDSSGIYRLHGRGVFDFAGNPLDSAHSTAVFAGSNLPDTVRPRFAVVALRDSARGYPPDQPIEVDFSKPVLQEPIHAAVSLADSARHPVEFSIRWLGPTDLLLSPQHELWGRAWYRLQMTLDSVIDMHGARYRDSTFSLRFQTMDFRNTGVINGVVVMDSAGGARGPVYVTAAGVDQTSPPKKSVKLASPGKFSLDRLPEGKYTIGAFIDADSSGSYTYGSPFPFVPSERFTVFADTVKVRARWSVEGVNLRFR